MNAGPPLGWILGAPATVNSTVNPSPSLPDGKLPCAHVAHLASVLYHKHRTQTASRPVESLFSFRFFALLDRVPLSLPNFCDFARLPWIFCDPLRSMVAPRQRERMNSLHKPQAKRWGKFGSRATWIARETAQAGDSHSQRLWKDRSWAVVPGRSVQAGFYRSQSTPVRSCES